MCDVILSKSVRKALQVLFVCFAVFATTGCAKSLSKAGQGALAGAALGAGSGAIIGNQSGNAGAGTAIGAGIGAVAGALMGNSMDKTDLQNEALGEKIRQNDTLLKENRELIEELKNRGADVRGTDRGVVINLPDILFRFDSDMLTPEANRTLAEIGEVLEGVKGRPIAVEGHTDNIGTVAYNKDLSLRRARSVSRSLARKGVPKQQMTVRGFGEGAPISTNNTDSGRARNRRVEIIVEN